MAEASREEQHCAHQDGQVVDERVANPALFLVLLLAQKLLHPAVNLLAIFAFEPDAFAGF